MIGIVGISGIKLISAIKTGAAVAGCNYVIKKRYNDGYKDGTTDTSTVYQDKMKKQTDGFYKKAEDFKKVSDEKDDIIEELLRSFSVKL